MTPPFRFPSRLYPIIDTLGDPRRSHLELAEAALRAGARFLQLRVKGRATRDFAELARAVQQRASARGALLIVNDRTDIALLVGAAGVHLGQDDLPLEDARRLLGPEKILGWSTHNLEQVRAAERSGLADYIGFGPIFETPSKENPDPPQGLPGLMQARAASRLPIAAIGGITAETAPAVLRAGADAVAVIGAICRAPDPEGTTAALLRNL